MWLVLIGLVACGAGSGRQARDSGGEGGVDLCASPDAIAQSGMDPCDVAAWTGLADDGDTVFVCTEGEDGGSGSLDAPLRTVAAGLQRAVDEGKGRVALAVGRYEEAVVLGREHDGMTVLGACRDGVELTVGEDTEGYDGAVVVLASTIASTTAAVQNLTVRGAELGVGAGVGTLRLSDARVLDAGVVGIGASGGFGTLVAERVAVEGPHDAGADLYSATLVQAADGGTVEGSELELLVRDWTFGVWVGEGDSSSVELDGCVLRAERGDCDGCGALGMLASSGSLAIRDCELTDLPGAGIVVEGAEADIAQTTVYGTRGGDLSVYSSAQLPCVDDASRALGAIFVRSGALVHLDDVTLEGNEFAGITLSESTLTGQGVRVLDTLPGGPDGAGMGVGALASDLRLTDTLIDGAVGLGLQAAQGGSLALDGVVVRGVEEITGTEPMGGWGLAASSGVEVSVHELLVEDVAYTAIDLRDTPVASLEDVHIERVYGASTGDGGVGLLIAEGAVVEVDGLVLGDVAHSAIVVTSSGQAAVTGAELSGVGSNSGWAVLAVPCLPETCADGTSGPNCCDATGARLDITDLVLGDCRDVAVGALGEGAHLTLMDASVSGIVPSDGSDVARGLVAGDGAVVELYDVDLSDIGGVGLLNYAADLTWSGGSLSDTWETGENLVAVGLAVQDGGVAGVEGVELRGTSGPGLFLHQATVDLRDVLLSDNRLAGGAVIGGSLVADGLQVQDNRAHDTQGGGAGLLLHATGDSRPSLRLTNSRLDSHPLAALFAQDPLSLEVSGSSLQGSEGASLTEGGSVLVHGNAAFVWGSTSSATVCFEDSSLAGAAVGLLLHELSGATQVCSLLSNSFEDNDSDVVQQPCGAGSAVDWPGAETCPEYELPTVEVALQLELTEPTVERGLGATWSN